MGKNAPAAPDYKGGADQQVQNNRPDQNNPFSFSSWSQDPSGKWTQSTGFNGGTGDIFNSLLGQSKDSLSSPLDFSGLPQVSNGEEARKAATDASYQRETSMLDPQWSQKEEQLKAQLMGQGATEGDPAYQRAMQQMSTEKDAAYQHAREGAITMGGEEQQRQFTMGEEARQQALSEMLKKRGLPLSELEGMEGMLKQSNFSNDNSTLQALLGLGNYNLGGADYNAQMWGDLGQGAGSIASMAPLLAMLSDERAKEDIQRLPVEAEPNIPFALYRYKGEGKGRPRRLGVIAQDVERAGRHDAVERDPNTGMRHVHYEKLRPFSLGR